MNKVFSPHPGTILTESKIPIPLRPLIICRRASLTSAIQRGIRRSGPLNRAKPSGLSRSQDRRRVERDGIKRDQNGSESISRPRGIVSQLQQLDAQRSSRYDSARRSVSHNGNPGVTGRHADIKRDGLGSRIRQSPPSKSSKDRDPTTEDKSHEDGGKRPTKSILSIPYTAADSEFLYGTTVVVAALKARRRKLHKLYVRAGETRTNPERDNNMLGLALSAGVPVQKMVTFDDLRLMEKLSGGRPHNGYILEASPLPKAIASSFEAITDITSKSLDFSLSARTSTSSSSSGKRSISLDKPHHRYPLVIMLHDVLDPQNLGAIVRTAFFYGVDCIILSEHHCAPLSAVALKASAGALEDLPIIYTNDSVGFVKNSAKKGWNFYATVPPLMGRAATSEKRRTVQLDQLSSDLKSHPCVLLMGGEGGGLPRTIRNAAQHVVGIPGRRLGEDGMDSLNVSVATGIFCHTFLGGTDTFNSQEETADSSDRLF